jgi:hypothetical protein
MSARRDVVVAINALLVNPSVPQTAAECERALSSAEALVVALRAYLGELRAGE